MAPDSPRDSEVLVLLSGGLDSACCLDFYLALGRSVSAVHVSYGQMAEEQELAAAIRLTSHYDVALIQGKWAAPSKHNTGEILGRNAFLVFAALLEATPNVTTIALGIHAGTAYADCSANFERATARLLKIYEPPSPVLGVPFLEWRKADVFAYANQRSVPVDLTYSCELGGTEPCGTCVSCLDMMELCAHAR